MKKFKTEELSIKQIDNWGGLEKYLNDSYNNGFNTISIIPTYKIEGNAVNKYPVLDGYTLIFEYHT